MNETFAASAVKVAMVSTGAALSSTPGMGTVGTIAGMLAATYSGIQIIKSLPWITDYFVAVRSGVHGDWSHWRSIAKKEEKGDDNPKS